MPPMQPSQRSQNSSTRQTDLQGNVLMDNDGESFPSLPSEMADRNQKTQDELLGNFVKRIVNAKSTAQLVALVPAPAQERTKRLLETIVQAHLKMSNADALLSEWRDALAKNVYTQPELKSLRAPSVQVSKLATEHGELDKNFATMLDAARKGALERMIEIKEAESNVLTDLCDPSTQTEKLSTGWKSLLAEEHVSSEAATILSSDACAESLVKTTISIGANAAYRQLEAKKKKTETQKKTGVDAAGKMPDNKQDLTEFIKAISKRQRQSAQDKQKAAKNKSGKGQRGAGPSKTKNQTKKTNKVSKRRQGKNAGASSKKQQKKR